MTNLFTCFSSSKVCQGAPKGLRMLLALFMVFCIGVGNVWGVDVTATLTLSSSVKFGTSSGSTLDDDKGNTWTCTGSSIQNTYSTDYSGQQFGSKNTNNSYTFACTLSGGATITSISATMAAGNSTPTYDISVGSSSKKSGSLSTTSTAYSTGTISATGEICITMNQNSASKAVYLGAISVSYSRKGMVIYNGNGNAGGTKPTDSNGYDSGDKATVLGNTDGLYKVGFTFAGWNTEANGSGTPYAPGDEITMGASDVTLYAQWTNTYAGRTFALVEDVSSLSAGDKIVILDVDHATAISTTQNNNNRASVAAGAADNAGFTMSAGNKVVTLASATTVQVITLEDLPTPRDSTFQFNVESGYLYASGSSNLKTRTPNEDAAGYWYINLTSGTFSISATVESTHKYLKKNSTSSLFSAYSSGQKDVLVYVACTPLGAIDDAEIEFTKTAYTLTVTWGKTEGKHETGYRLQLYNNNGTGVKGSAIGDPVVIDGVTDDDRTYTFGAKTPVGDRLTHSHEYFVGITPTYDGDGDYCASGTEVAVSETTGTAYTVTYAAGTGGSGTMEDPITSYETGDEVSVLENDFYKNGYHFDGWTYSPAQSVTDGKFTMGSADVTITATWATNTDKFKDIIHGNTISNKTGNYGTMPAALSDEDPGSGCSGKHYKFMGWIEASGIGNDGKPNGTKPIIPAGESGHYATNTTYYAVWAAENE